VIVTQRLELIPATPASTQAALDGPVALGTALRAAVPASWPPEFLDTAALEFTLEWLRTQPEQAGWWMYFVVLGGGEPGRVLIGSAGFKGPAADGTVEIGYGVVRDHQRRGYASEAVRGLVKHAFATPEVERVIAETLPELTASIGVLAKCAFRLTGEGSEPGVIRYELTRAAYEPAFV
jgi:ribosomal-protein-alanine N-acetyltransferase